MGRTNKTLQGAFTKIVGSTKTKSAIEQFLDRFRMPGEYCLAKETREGMEEYSVAGLIQEYKDRITEFTPQVHILAKLETIIMQLKTRSELNDIILYINKGKYIYARCPFYRADNDVNEIRTIIGLTTMFLTPGQTLEDLYNNQEFMEMVKEKIALIMEEEIFYSAGEYDLLKNYSEYSK